MLKTVMFVLAINSGDVSAIESYEFESMDSCIIAAIIENDIAADKSANVVHVCEYVEEWEA